MKIHEYLILGITLTSASLALARQAPTVDIDPESKTRVACLQRAYEVASAMPLKPHIKNRSRAQEHVVVTCLELAQPELAQRFADGIENWRRAIAYADLAKYYAEQDQAELALRLAAQAQGIAERHELGAEGWRQERILSKVAEARYRLGEREQATRLVSGFAAAERPVFSTETLTPEQVVEFLNTLPSLAQAGQLETMLRALDACVPLFEKNYSNVTLRERIYKDMRNAWSRVPGLERVKLAQELAEVCLQKEDIARAQVLLSDTRALMDGMRWEPRYLVPAQAQLAQLRFLARNAELAQSELAGAWELYQSRREEIINIYRTETLLPVAEAYMQVGAMERAGEIYAQALEESIVNPNSRPRAIDLTEILCSMARTGFDPDEEIQARVEQIQSELGDPW